MMRLCRILILLPRHGRENVTALSLDIDRRFGNACNCEDEKVFIARECTWFQVP
jgi:hypothetical protein